MGHPFFFFENTVTTNMQLQQRAVRIKFIYNPVTPSPLTLLLLNTTCPVLTNSVDSDQLASAN